MKQLIGIGLGLAALFASTFIVVRLTGVLSVEDIKTFLSLAHEAAPVYVAAVIVLLLAADLFIAVPTLTLNILSGYFLGFPLGFLAGALGMLSAGVLGYAITFAYGPGLLRRINKDEAKQAEMEAIFAQYGFVVLAVSRALPILPEVSCCLAGSTRMRFPRFVAAFMLGTIPYALIATYAGSQSSLDDPKPAIFAAIGLSALLAAAWTVLIRRYKAQEKG